MNMGSLSMAWQAPERADRRKMQGLRAARAREEEKDLYTTPRAFFGGLENEEPSVWRSPEREGRRQLQHKRAARVHAEERTLYAAVTQVHRQEGLVHATTAANPGEMAAGDADGGTPTIISISDNHTSVQSTPTVPVAASRYIGGRAVPRQGIDGFATPLFGHPGSTRSVATPPTTTSAVPSPPLNTGQRGRREQRQSSAWSTEEKQCVVDGSKAAAAAGGTRASELFSPTSALSELASVQRRPRHNSGGTGGTCTTLQTESNPIAQSLHRVCTEFVQSLQAGSNPIAPNDTKDNAAYANASNNRRHSTHKHSERARPVSMPSDLRMWVEGADMVIMESEDEVIAVETDGEGDGTTGATTTNRLLRAPCGSTSHFVERPRSKSLGGGGAVRSTAKAAGAMARAAAAATGRFFGNRLKKRGSGPGNITNPSPTSPLAATRTDAWQSPEREPRRQMQSRRAERMHDEERMLCDTTTG